MTGRPGRPKVFTEPLVQLGVRIPESLHERLMTAAAERDISAAHLVRRAIEDYLPRLPSLP